MSFFYLMTFYLQYYNTTIIPQSAFLICHIDIKRSLQGEALIDLTINEQKLYEVTDTIFRRDDRITHLMFPGLSFMDGPFRSGLLITAGQIMMHKIKILLPLRDKESKLHFKPG